MDKTDFIHVIQHYAGSTVTEAEEVLSLKKKYPYSQLLHALSARLSKDHGFAVHQAELQLAAVYAADRGVLKEVMTATEDDVAADTSVSRTITARVESTPLVTTPISIENNNLADELIHDLEKLNELRHNFELLFADVDPKVVEPTVAVKVEHRATSESQDMVSEDHQVKKRPAEKIKDKSGMTRRQRIIALAKEADQKAELEAQQDKERKETVPVRKKKDSVTDELIEEIEKTKSEINPETEKQKEQIEIINQFIQAQPSISNAKDKPVSAPVGDLTTIKSGEFGDNIVSETLVDILLKQGKKDKAIEVLKKLIWKFPQKKAYFAAQIEELKK